MSAVIERLPRIIADSVGGDVQLKDEAICRQATRNHEIFVENLARVNRLELYCHTIPLDEKR